MLYILLKFVLGFKKLDVIIDPTKEQMIESLDDLKETVTSLTTSKTSKAKEKNKLVVAAIINVGFYLNADYQPHMDIIEERNTKLESTVDE